MRRRALPLVVIAVAATLGAAFLTARVKDYLTEDPGFCAQCHRASPEFALWRGSGHRGVACQRCHHASTEEGLAMMRAFLAGRSPDGARGHARVEVGACGACHLSHDQRWPQIASSRGHRLHVVERKIGCLACHGGGVHGLKAVSASCRGCHGEHAVRVAGMARLHCFTCHDFLGPEPGLRPTRRDCLACHEAEGVVPARFAAGAPMQFECGRCHKPHAPAGEERVGCGLCHAQIGRAGLHALRGHADCRACHVAHLWRAGPAACAGCHPGAAAHAGAQTCAACHGFRGDGPVLHP